MNKEIMFSIIIPTYNSTKLQDALNSIEECGLNYEDYEVIIVDDCSSQKDFLNILSDYNFNYILIENEANLKQGLARQVGLDHAQGTWVTFLDHDDIFIKGSLEIVKKEILESGCKFAYYSTIVVSPENEWWNYIQQNGDIKYSQYQKSFGCDIGMHWLHGNFFKRQILNYYGIRFHNQIKGHEDTYFLTVINGICLQELEKDDKFAIESKTLTYVWFLWDNSLSHSYKDDEYDNYFDYTFEDYISAVLDGWKFINQLYRNQEMATNKLLSLFFTLYWNFQIVAYHQRMSHRKNDHLPNLLIFCKKTIQKICLILGISSFNALIEVLYHNPRMYGLAYENMVMSNNIGVIPEHTLIQWLLLVEKAEVNLTEDEIEECKYHRRLFTSKILEENIIS